MEDVQSGEKWYEGINYEDAKIFIKSNIASAARSFIAIGYYLKAVKTREMYLQDDHASIWDFAQAEYGISKSTASRYMTMNDRFSQDGNSPLIAEEYKGFGKSQLQEMLSLTDSQIEQVKPTDRVEDIRGIRRPKEIPYVPIPGQVELSDFPGVEPGEAEAAARAREETTAREMEKPVYTISAADLLPVENQESVAISQQTPTWEPQPEPQPEPEPEPLSAYGGREADIPGIRQEGRYCVEAPMGNPFACEMIAAISVLGEKIGKECQFVNLDTAHHRAGDHEPAPCCKDCRKPCEYVCGRAMKRVEAESESGPELAQELLAEAMETAASAQEPEFTKQPELPILKNNDQRKAWLDDYGAWGLWYRDENIGASYYKYDFENGARLVVEEYEFHNQYLGDYTSSYLHLIGGPKPSRNPTYGCNKWNYSDRYNRNANSETELIEFLKEIQRKG